MAVTFDRTTIPLGSHNGDKQSIVIVPGQDASDKPGILAFEAVNDSGVRTRYFTWFDSNGVYRYHTSIPTNQDSDGSTITSGASTTLNNLGTVACNTSLISDAANTDDLGSDPLSWRTLYWTTSLKKIGTTWDVTLAATEPAAASYTYTFPDAGASANVMLDTGAANVIAYTKGTSTIAFAANADLDIATGCTVNIDQNLTVNTEAVTLNQSLSTTDAVAFATGSTIGNLTLANGSITDSGGAISFGDENVTTTGTINIALDNVNLTIGASGATDSRIYFDGAGNLKFYDSNLGVARSLTEMYTGTSLNPTVTGNLAVGDGNFTWTNTASGETAVWTLAATTVDGIQIASSNTSADALQITANATSSGNLISLNSVDATMTSGAYIYCYDGAAQDFAVRRYGATTIAGNAIATAALTLTKGDAVLSDGRLLVTQSGDNTSKIARNVTTLTTAVFEIEQGHASGGVGLLVDQGATGDLNAVEVTNAGTGFSVTATAAAAAGQGYEFIAAASGTGKGLFLDGSTGSYIGADNTGFAEITSDGVLAAGANLLRVTSSGLNAAGSFLVEVEQTGKVVAATDGICLKISETAAETATSYAVCIASTNNEALHVDTGLTLFDERVTITLADNTGPALAITNPDTTGNTNAATITPSGSGYGLYVAPQEADTMGIGIVAAAASTVPYIKLDGVTGTGYVGAANVGLLHLVNDGNFADVAASMFYIGSSGVPTDDSRGHCLRIVDTGNAAAGTMAYPVYISSNDATVGGVYITTSATGAALTVAAGTASFAGLVTFTAGLKTKVAVTDTANPPTNNEAITAFGAAATTGAGFIGIIDDADGHANEYIIWSDGTKYWQVTGTACA